MKKQRASVRPKDSAKAPLPESFMDDLMEASMRSHTFCTAGNTSYSMFDMSTTQFSTTQRDSNASKVCYMDPLPDEMEATPAAAAAPVKEELKPSHPPPSAPTEPKATTATATITPKPQPPRPISPKPEARSARPLLPEEPRARAIARARARAAEAAAEAAKAKAQQETADSFSTSSLQHRPSTLLTSQKRSSRTSLQVGDLTISKMGMGKESSWYAMSCTSKDSAMYDSYKNASSLKHMTVEEGRASIVEQMYLSRGEKDALNAVHGFCFSESEDEDDDESDIDNEDDMPVERQSL